MPDAGETIVWVVPLSREPWPGWPPDLTPVDEIERHRIYHYPARNYYPKEPPERMAFRYDGEVKSVHGVESYSVVQTPYGHVPGAPDMNWDEPHFLLRLGPPTRPDHRIRTGKGIYGPARHWVEEDLLLQAPSLAEAMRASKQRRSSR